MIWFILNFNKFKVSEVCKFSKLNISSLSQAMYSVANNWFSLFFFWNFCIFLQNFLISYFAKFSHFSRVKEMQTFLRINCFSKKCEIFAKQFFFFAGNPRSRCWSYVHQEVAKQLKKSMYIIKDKNCPNHTENSFRVAIMLNLYWQMTPPPLPFLSQCSAP